MLRLDEKTSYFLYTIFLVLLGYICLGWASLYLFNFKKFHLLDLYFLPSFILMFSTLFLFIRREKAFRLWPHLEKKEWMAISMVVFTFCLTRYLKIDEMRIWLDEYTQFIYGVQSHGYSLIEFSFYEQQPPLDYMLSGFAKMFFGFSPLALKFHVLFFSLLFFLLLPFCFRLFTHKLLPRYSVVMVLLMSRPLMIYSMEARPLMLSTFFSLLTMTFVMKSLVSRSMLSFLAALFSAMVYTTTTGLQPQIFLLIFCIGLYFVGFEQRLNPLKIGILSFIFNLPVIYFLIEFTQKTNQFTEKIFDKLKLVFTFEGVREVASILVWDPYLLAIPCCLIGAAAISNIYKEADFKIKRMKVFIIIFPFAYILVYALTYYSFISWLFSTRYMLNFYSGYSFFLLLGTMQFFDLKKSFLKILLLTSFFILFLFGSYRVIKHPFVWYVASAQRLNWKGLYGELNNRVVSGDKIIKFTLTNIGNWRGSILVGEDFYANELVRENTLKNTSFDDDINITVFCDGKADYLKSSTGKLYIVHDPLHLSGSVDSITVKEMGFKLVRSFDTMQLYSIDMDLNAYRTIKKYFDSLIKRYKNTEPTTPLLESMFCLESRFGTRKGFESYLNDYEEIKVDQTWSKSGQYFDKNKELQKRINYFKKMMDERWK